MKFSCSKLSVENARQNKGKFDELHLVYFTTTSPLLNEPSPHSFTVTLHYGSAGVQCILLRVCISTMYANSAILVEPYGMYSLRV